ncbi:hypothetical protein GCM10009850_032030 [Nonomuraea monospora]|uniref:Secreted protein n=1 Tax=Nonomuraea monospora TaxID=568818 RepID=A0ABN3CG53_9ACTN
MHETHDNIGHRTMARALALLAALVMALTCVIAGTGAAQADARETFPPAPEGAQARNAAAVSPGISPAARRTYHANPGDPWNCPLGNLCTAVWDNTTGNWKAFDLYTCHRYALSHWEGYGEYTNNQTGNVTSFFYGQFLEEKARFTPDYPIVHGVDWSPIWHIRNC